MPHPEDFPTPSSIVCTEPGTGSQYVSHDDLAKAMRRAVGIAVESSWKIAFDWLARKCEIEL